MVLLGVTQHYSLSASAVFVVCDALIYVSHVQKRRRGLIVFHHFVSFQALMRFLQLRLFHLR